MRSHRLPTPISSQRTDMLGVSAHPDGRAPVFPYTPGHQRFSGSAPGTRTPPTMTWRAAINEKDKDPTYEYPAQGQPRLQTSTGHRDLAPLPEYHQVEDHLARRR